MRTVRLIPLFAAAAVLGGCGLFGEQPEQHTVIDYESLDPGQGAESVGKYPYGHTGTRHSGTGQSEEDTETDTEK